MLNKLFTFSFLILLLSSVPLWATTYYLDYSNGSNANDGLSPATAWQDLFKINASNPTGGDTYLFKRGEQWEGLQFYITSSGTAAQSITFGAYGSSSELPIISIISSLAMADNPTSWTQTSSNIWTLSLVNTPGRLFLDGVEKLRASTLVDLGISDSQGAIGHWYYDVPSHLLYLSSTQNPTNLYNTIEGSLEFYTILAAGTDHLVFENLDIRGGWGASLGILGGTNMTIRNCMLGHSANSGLTIIDSGGNGTGLASSNITVEFNTFDSNFTFFYGLGSERGCGDGLKLFYSANNCIARNNTFLNWAHNAIELLGNSASGSGVNNNQFYDNTISAPNIPYAHPLGADGFAGKCQNNEFYRNRISNCRTASQINGNNNWVHHNIIEGMDNSPSKNEPTAYAFILGIYGAGLVSENNRFDHNLIIDTDEAGFLIRGYGFSGQVQNNSIRNNILYETAQAPYNNAYSIGTGFVIYDTNLDGVGGNTYQNNLFYSSTSSTNAVFTQDNSTYYSATQFNALNGVDGNTIENNLSGDPLFTNLASGNYLPLDNSPAVNAGIDVGLSTDYLLNPRFIGPAPDIGPIETNVLTPFPVNWGAFWVDVSKNMNAILYWETHSEQNSKSFIIERSTNNQLWEVVGRTPAEGNSNQLNLYQFTDQAPPTGVLYYRLQQIDHDGQVNYSKVISCEIKRVQKLTIARVDQGTIRLLSESILDWPRIQIRILDSVGKQWATIKGKSELNIDGLPFGVYFLLVEKENSIEVLSFAR